MSRAMVIFLLCFYYALAHEPACPLECSCRKNNINCSNKGLLSLDDIHSTEIYDTINISRNNFLWIPAVNVKNLDASSNLLQVFPIVGQPIHSLFLKNNSIKYIHSPECPSTLRVLDISENPIKEVDLTCDGLERLDLSYGDIEIIPEDFLYKFRSLQVLNFDHNPLKKINGDLRSDTLEVISLQDSHLRYIKPSTFTKLSKIKVINISGNKHIHSINLMSGAELIIANHCGLEAVNLSDMPRVRGVEINNNHITNLILPNSVLELRASNNLIYDIDLKQIKRADLSKNSIMSIHLDSMEFLNISGNPLSKLRLASIHYLDASQCKINNIEVFGAKLHTLNLSHNALEVFPDRLSVKILDLSFNRLSRFKLEIEGVEELRLNGNRFVLAEDVLAQGEMYLSDNPWTCDCKMDHLYLSARDAKTLTCSHPRNVTGRTWSEACYKSKVPRWMLDRPYIPFIISTVLLLLAMFFFYWLRRKLDPPTETSDEEEQTEAENVLPQIRINNELPSYEEALLMPSLSRKKNTMTQTRSYEVLSRRLSSNSI